MHTKRLKYVCMQSRVGVIPNKIENLNCIHLYSFLHSLFVEMWSKFLDTRWAKISTLISCKTEIKKDFQSAKLFGAM